MDSQRLELKQEGGGLSLFLYHLRVFLSHLDVGQGGLFYSRVTQYMDCSVAAGDAQSTRSMGPMEVAWHPLSWP